MSLLHRKYDETTECDETTNELQRLKLNLRRLQQDLLHILPKSSNTMSALRQRDITYYVNGCIDKMLEKRDD